MKAKCIAAINAAAGRVLSSLEVRRIESAIESAGTRMAQAQRDAWRFLPIEERTAMVAQAAERELQAMAREKRDVAMQQLLDSMQASAPTTAGAIEGAATARRNSSTEAQTSEAIQSKRARQIAAQQPDMMVMLDSGETVSVAEAMRMADHDFAQNHADAQLAQVATECFMSMGDTLAAGTAGTAGAAGAASAAAPGALGRAMSSNAAGKVGDALSTALFSVI